MSKEGMRIGFARNEFSCGGESIAYARVLDIPGANRLPVCLRVLLENVLRRASTEQEAQAAAHRIVEAGLAGEAGGEIEFMPARVLFQDFTGVPVFVDFAAMRDAASNRGGDASRINPQIPCTLVVDHSVAADVVSCSCAALENARIEAERNAERFSFLKWSAKSFDNVQIVPPGVGICHQLNIERFCQVAMTDGSDCPVMYFDSLVGTDSHTTTANGMGVLGWGVGGIEAEAAALGQPITMLVPPVVGVRLTGSLPVGVSAMDLALTFAERLRSVGVVGKLVECFGEGVSTLTATQRATVANMTPEYGCTSTFFPADEKTFAQLELSGTDAASIEKVQAFLRAQGVDAESLADADIVYSEVIDIDLSAIEPSLAGPSRPHNRVVVSGLQGRFRDALAQHGRTPQDIYKTVSFDGEDFSLTHGALGIAAVTSCTTATDPAMMIAAGLVAKKAQELGCTPLPWVKKVLAPGSHSTTEILSRAGLVEPLAQMGFSVCGWGCMSCIGNSGPLFDPMHEVADELELTSILSGNRNFDGRISPDVAQNYLAAPAFVVAYSLAGTLDIDLSREPVCMGTVGPVYLADLLPQDEDVEALLREVVSADLFAETGKTLFDGDEHWRSLSVSATSTFEWGEDSTYVRRPPYFEDAVSNSAFELSGARVLANLGDFVTTDHLSPAGAIASDSPAARYLREHGIEEPQFNTYGSRRGNHEVMMRGCLANVKLVNKLAGGKVGGYTWDHWDGCVSTIFDVSQHAAAKNAPLVILAGKMYGSGSSRDWAAKAPQLLGVRAVIAESFERIHRSNLVGMGILPLQFKEGESADSLGLDGHEIFDIAPVDFSQGLASPSYARITASREDGSTVEFEAEVRVDTPTEGAYFCAGGILPYVLDTLMA